jgi:hypothetical protein
MSEATTVPYSSLLQQFKSAPPGKLYCIHGAKSVYRMSLAAAAHVLLNGLTVALVDGTNRFDPYYLAEFARRHAGAGSGGRQVTPEDFLDNIHVSRAFTCYQMEAVITERLPAFVRRTGTPVVIVFGLLDTFYDEQAPLFEVKAGVRRMVKALRSMDQVYCITETERGERILNESAPALKGDRGCARIPGRIYGPNGPNVHNGDPAGDGELGKIPARVAQGRPGCA